MPLATEQMGAISDRLSAQLAAMRAADERAAAATAAVLAKTRELIGSLESDMISSDPVADAIALLESHGYRITPPA